MTSKRYAGLGRTSRLVSWLLGRFCVGLDRKPGDAAFLAMSERSETTWVSIFDYRCVFESPSREWAGENGKETSGHV